ncbi:outer membrane beta-barrel protein [Bacteroides sp. 51]|uniref:outer membrane beta-barrel protein n=1 Tax=Bacteroides sp. 51 TaxID=2302938 RepID=UPI0013D08ABB|nr:outer membrane beta-barrel protein [Bacteroides sp. 51]NDV82621.1 signal protein [Bacteroides sp. 51]
MKRIYILFLISLSLILPVSAQIQVNDTMFLFLDSLFMELPEVMIKGERPIVKAEDGKLVYDLPRLVEKMPVDNAYDAIRELPGVIDNGGLQLAGSSVNLVINGKVSTLSEDQLIELLKTIPVGNIEKAEVMYSAPARYQVRGPMINLVLKSGGAEKPTLQGELYTGWQQYYYERLTERASLLYSSSKFSADLLYSYNHGRGYDRIDKEALHTVNGTVYPMNLSDITRSRSNNHNVRLGMDYRFTKDNLLSFVYTTQIRNRNSRGVTTGTQDSKTKNKGDNQLHNIKMDYRASFGLSAGAEMTYYDSPGNQELHSILNDEEIDARYENEQRINKWRFYLTQEHTLKNNWGLNYGINYTTAVDNSFQNYYDFETGELQPDKSMTARRKEYTWNGFVGFTKSFGEKVSLDASLAAELYHTEVWDEWMFYPTLNLNYTPKPGHILQLSFTSDKDYPAFWSMQNSVSYMSAYTLHYGNPLLKPATEYSANLTYILKGKYVFVAHYDHDKDYSVQTLYQRPDELVEVYKEFNSDFRQRFGIQAVIPLKMGNWLSSRFLFWGYHTREKDSDFWDISYDRRSTSFIATMSNTITLSTKPNISLNVSGFYQNGTIQGIYDLPRSGYVDASLRWSFANEKATLTLKGNDLFETAAINPKIRFQSQNLTNKFLAPTRGIELSFSYKFGNYKEKKREDVDTSRFK